METAVSYSFSDYYAAAKRRFRPTLATSVLILCGATLLAFKLPASYESSTTILIEQQQIPQDFVRSTVNRYADEQLQILNQLVLTRDRLTEISQRHNVFPDQDELSAVDLLAEFRENITMETISASVVNPGTGRESSATIAFTLAFENGSPEVAQAVTSELADLYLEENTRSRRELAANTSAFLRAEAEALEAELVRTEDAVAIFRERNSRALPEMMVLNVQALERAQRDLDNTARELLSLANRRVLLEAELEQLALVGGNDELTELRRQYISASAIYEENHPDVVRLRGQIAALGGSTATGGSDVAVLSQQIETMSAELDAARSTYSSDHPDVLRLEREFAALRATLADVLANPSPVAEAFEVATPAEIRVRTELRSIQTEVAGLRTREREYRERVENYEGRLAQQPLIEREYDSLQRTYNAALRNYTEISDNLATAERAETLESESQAQRYILIESAYLPMEPLAPNRPAIVVVGLILAIAVAISMVIFLEAADGTVRGAKDVLNVSQYPPIGVIPVIKNTKDRRRILIGKAVYAGSLALMVTTTIALLQYT